MTSYIIHIFVAKKKKYDVKIHLWQISKIVLLFDFTWFHKEAHLEIHLSPKGCYIFQNPKDLVSIRWLWNALQSNQSAKDQLERMEPGHLTVMELSSPVKIHWANEEGHWAVAWLPGEKKNLKRSQISPRKYWVEAKKSE